MISNVCAQVDQDDVTRKCERVYVRRMNILITAIEERVTPAPVLTLDTGTGGLGDTGGAGLGHAAPNVRA